MAQPGYRHRILVIDRSGSIADILSGQQSGMREFFGSEAGVPGKATYSLWDFDHEIRCLHSFAAMEEVRGYQIEPRGTTAMYDAIGLAVAAERARIAGMEKGAQPEDVTVIVSSDGLNNVSDQLHNATRLNALLAAVQAGGGARWNPWRVLYMGCNQDAIKEGGYIGTRYGMTVNTVSTDDGQRNAWKMSADYLRRAPVAAAAAGGYEVTPEERSLGESAETNDAPAG
ncbi:MAG TPA: hypothetical protein VGG75_38260 [Trebonia sp.]|jgi:hypothetical protein